MDNYEIIDSATSDLVNFNEMIEDELCGYKRYPDACYRGGLHHETDTRSGIGIMKYRSGRIYEGEWKYD